MSDVEENSSEELRGLEGDSDEDSADFEERNEAFLREHYEGGPPNPRKFGSITDSRGRVHMGDNMEIWHVNFAPYTGRSIGGKSQTDREVVVVDRELAANLLEDDRLSRDSHHFPLVTHDEIINMIAKYRFVVNEKELLFCEGRENDLYKLVVDDMSLEDRLDTLRDEFPDMEEFLTRGEGHLVAAGGGITSLFQVYCRGGKDLDFFFHGLKTDEAEAIVQKLIKWWLGREDPMFFVYRNRHATTFLNMTDNAVAYQVIHRCYENEGMVIGGFDLAPCSVLYNGQNVLATRAGAFALASGLMIVDTSRRSFSHHFRILKYEKKGYRPVFICKPISELVEKLPFGKHYDRKMVTISQGVRILIKQSPRASYCYLMSSPQKGFMEQRNDYDSGQEFNFWDMEATNCLMASRGNIDVICWGGNKLENLSSPLIPRLENRLDPIYDIAPDDIMHPLSHGYWFDHFPMLSSTGKREALYRWFGAEYIAYRNADIGSDDEFITAERLEELSTRVEAGLAAVEASKGQLNWLGMNDNPQRQRHTSSIRPISETISFYTPEVIRTLTIGLPHEVWKVIAAGRRERECGFSWLPRDVFRMVMVRIRDTMVAPALKW